MAQHRLGDVEDLAAPFFRDVLDFEYGECLVTDESDLRDLADGLGDRARAVEEMLDRVERHDLIDARVLGSTRIVELLEFLAARGRFVLKLHEGRPAWSS